MSIITARHASTRMLILSWVIAALLALFFIENTWIDPLLARRYPHLPTLVPPAESTQWLIVFALGGFLCTALVVALIFTLVKPTLPTRAKIAAGAAFLFTTLFWIQWSLATNGSTPLTARQLHRPGGGSGSVLLKWNASSSKVIGYNVYRSTVPGKYDLRLNSLPVKGLTYTDTTAQSDMTYFYITRAVDDKGLESTNSNEISASIP